MIFNKDTEKLINGLKENSYKSDNQDTLFSYSFIQEHTSFNELVKSHLNRIQMSPAKLFKIIEVSDSQNAYKKLNGSRPIERDLAIRILLAFKTPYEDVQEIFKNYEIPILYPKKTRDSIIIQSLFKKLSVDQTIDLLHSNNEKSI